MHRLVTSTRSMCSFQHGASKDAPYQAERYADYQAERFAIQFTSCHLFFTFLFASVIISLRAECTQSHFALLCRKES